MNRTEVYQQSGINANTPVTQTRALENIKSDVAALRSRIKQGQEQTITDKEIIDTITNIRSYNRELYDTNKRNIDTIVNDSYDQNRKGLALLPAEKNKAKEIIKALHLSRTMSEFRDTINELGISIQSSRGNLGQLIGGEKFIFHLTLGAAPRLFFGFMGNNPGNPPILLGITQHDPNVTPSQRDTISMSKYTVEDLLTLAEPTHFPKEVSDHSQAIDIFEKNTNRPEGTTSKKSKKQKKL